MFSPRRIGRVFLSLLTLNCLIFAACSKSKSNLDESEFTQSDESCMNTAEGCSLDQFGTGGGTTSGTSTGTATGTATGTGTGSGLSQTTLNPNLNQTDIFNQPQQTVSGQQQTSCYSGLNFNYGLNGTGSNYTTDWNSFGQLGQPQQQSATTGCMANNMSSTGAANLGVASYAEQNNCLSQAYQALKLLKGTSTAPNLTARRISIMVYARCSMELVQKQSNTFQWTTNNLTSFGYVQYYLSQFLQMLAQQSWY